MKLFRQMDEMEMSINFRALRVSWVLGLVALLVWAWWEWIQTRTFNSIAFIIMLSQLIVYWSVQLFLKWKLGKDEE